MNKLSADELSLPRKLKFIPYIQKLNLWDSNFANFYSVFIGRWPIWWPIKRLETTAKSVFLYIEIMDMVVGMYFNSSFYTLCWMKYYYLAILLSADAYKSDWKICADLVFDIENQEDLSQRHTRNQPWIDIELIHFSAVKKLEQFCLLTPLLIYHSHKPVLLGKWPLLQVCYKP